MDVLQLLLSREKVLPVQEKEVKIKRLSPKGQEPVIFSLRSLSYNRVAELKKTGGEDIRLHILLAGIKSPDLKSQELLDKYGAATPLELLKILLLPGEIEDLSLAVERLSGYRVNTIEEIKKK